MDNSSKLVVIEYQLVDSTGRTNYAQTKVWTDGKVRVVTVP